LNEDETIAIAVVVANRNSLRQKSSLATLKPSSMMKNMELYDNRVAALFSGYRPDLEYVR
jgi:hypothetical protein